MMDENLSQSNSSASSTNSSVQDQKSVQNFKEKIKQEQNPFFVRYFIRLGVVFFLVVLAASSNFASRLVIEYVFVHQFISFLDKSYTKIDIMYKQYETLLSIPNAFRTIYQIYEGQEAEESEVFEDRTSAYLEIVTPRKP